MRGSLQFKRQHFLRSDFWNEIKLVGEQVSNRSNGTMISYKNRIYLFGGDEIEANSDINHDFIFFEYDSGSQHLLNWQKVKQQNPDQGPTNLIGHTANLVGNELYLIGGKENSFKYSEKLFIFNLDSGIWQQQDLPELLKSIDSHTSCLYFKNQELINKEQENIQKQQQQNNNSNNNNDKENKNMQIDEIKEPVSINENQQQQNDNDDNNNKDNNNSKDQFYSQEEKNNISLIIYGGFNIMGYQGATFEYNLGSQEWEQITEYDKYKYHQLQIPVARSNHGAAIKNHKMYVFGGSKGSERLNDLYYLDLQKNKWIQIKTKFTPHYRSGHSMCVYNDELIIFGGLKSLMYELNDVYAFNTVNQTWRQLEGYSDYSGKTDSNLNSQTQIGHTKTSKNSIIFKVHNKLKAVDYLNKGRIHKKVYHTHQEQQQMQQYHQNGRPSNFNTLNINISKSYVNSPQQSHRDVQCNEIQELHQSHKIERKKTMGDSACCSPRENVDFSTFRETTLNNRNLNRFFGKPSQGKKYGLNTLYGNINKIKISPLLNQNQKKEQLKETKKIILLKEFDLIKVDESQDSSIVQTMKLAIQQVQKKTTENSVNVVHNDQKTVMNITNIIDSSKNRIYGKKPMPRDGHASCMIGNKLIIFGGDRHRLTFNDVFELDLKSISESRMI